jgi:hypothetical protein
MARYQPLNTSDSDRNFRELCNGDVLAARSPGLGVRVAWGPARGWYYLRTDSAHMHKVQETRNERLRNKKARIFVEPR